MGLLHRARGEHALARAEFERTLAARPVAPPTFLAAAYVEAGRVLELEGQSPRAIDMYRAALRVRGAEPRTRDDARAALERQARRRGEVSVARRARARAHRAVFFAPASLCA